MTFQAALNPVLKSITALLLGGTVALAAATYISVDITLTQKLGDLSLGVSAHASPVMGVNNPTIKNGVAYVSASHALGDWAIDLSPKLPISLTIKSQQGDAALDLRSLKFSALSITQQLGDLELKLPAANLSMVLTQGQGDSSITLPPGVGLRLNVKKFAQGTLIINGKTVADGFDFDGLYSTDNYNSAKYKINVTVTKKLGTLTVK